MKRVQLFFLAASLAALPALADMPPVKPAPQRPPEGPSVVVQEFEVLPDCAAEKVCAEALIRNIGLKPAYGVRLRIDLGGTKYGKPRASFYQDLEKDQLDPTEAESVSMTVDRKFPYKNEKGEDKVMEVGRFNVKMVPVWRDSLKPPPPKKNGTLSPAKRK